MNDIPFLDFIDFFPNGIIITDHKTIIKHANTRVYDIFGYNENELQGLPIETLLPDKLHRIHKERTKEFSQCPKQMNMSVRSGLMGKHKNESHFPVDVSLAPIKMQDEQFFMAIVQDISEKEYIKKLKTKNKQLEEFTRIASHDLQEPLRTILSLSKLVINNENKHLDQDTKQIISFIDQSANKMSELVKALLDYNKLSIQNELESVNCNVLFQEVLNDLTVAITDSKASIDYNELPTIIGYKTELRMLAQNLLSNAIKFAKKETSPNIKITYENTKNNHIFKIRDKGIGMDKKNQDKIFDVFTTLNNKNEYPGTGIGLALCKRIAEMHKGELSVQSALGEGSCFTIQIKKDLI